MMSLILHDGAAAETSYSGALVLQTGKVSRSHDVGLRWSMSRERVGRGRIFKFACVGSSLEIAEGWLVTNIY